MPLTLPFPEQHDESRFPTSFWRSLHYFNVYRFILAVLALGASFIFTGPNAFGNEHPHLYSSTVAVFMVSAVVFFATIHFRRPRFNLQLTAQVAVDVLALTLLMYASGGMRSGIALLLLPSLAAAGLISRGRMALFHAAMASIAVLSESWYRNLESDFTAITFSQPAMLCIGYFATAWLATALARQAQQNERLAQQRGHALVNLAEINRLVIQDLQDGVIVVDEQQILRLSNGKAEELLGPLPGDLRQITLAVYAPELSRQLKAFNAEDTMGPPAPFTVARTGRQVRVRFVSILVGQSRGFIAFLEDMSVIQAQSQQIKLAALGRLTANIAHEIRNPLSAISHAAELLREEPDPSRTMLRLTEIIHDNCFRLERMVQDVLRLNRRDRVQLEVIDLQQYVRQFLDEFVQVEKIPPETMVMTGTPPPILFDQAHLHQVLWNLCRNAWRYSRRQPGSIALRMECSRDRVQLSVTDDGPGVAPDLVAQLFEPFATTDSKGTGLGLYIARELCDANQATLDYVAGQSGAQFRVTFRRANEQNA